MTIRKQVSSSDFSSFLKREYPNDKAWKGFFKLWLDAKGFDYGKDDEHIVDGSGDGGIDAIAYPPQCANSGFYKVNLTNIHQVYFTMTRDSAVQRVVDS